jgi:indolepyruvate ferredoxin oxidoreductase
MMIFGAAWQKGLIPLGHAAILKAIELNGAAAERNSRAFEIGRWAVLHPAEAEKLLTPNVVALPKSLDERISYRADHLADYQSRRLAKRYRKLVDGIAEPRLKDAVAKGYHKVLAYKDEYEVARLLLKSEAKAKEEFEGDLKLTYHLAPPILSKTGADRRPVKRAFSDGYVRIFKLLSRFKRLRGTPLDIFGYSAERKMERALIRQYETDMAAALPKVTEATLDAVVALAELPLAIRGFGPVKDANARKAAKRREELLAAIAAGTRPMKQAAE